MQLSRTQMYSNLEVLLTCTCIVWEGRCADLRIDCSGIVSCITTVGNVVGRTTSVHIVIK